MKKKLTLLLVALLGCIIWKLPHSSEITAQGWHIFTIFITLIVGIIANPIPMGALVIIALTLTVTTNTLSLTDVLSGFHNSTAWLVLLAFFVSKAIIKSGLGERLACIFVKLFGKSTLGLGYGILLGDYMLSPAIPSSTARSGGITYSIASGLAKAFGSCPTLGTQKQIGTFLMTVGYQGSVITSTAFMTAMAANPLSAGIAAQAGCHISWALWAKAAFLPSILSLIVVPFVIYKLRPPILKASPEAVTWSKNKLKEMGKMKYEEICTALILLLLIGLWIFGDFFKCNATTAAFIGTSLFLVTEVLEWKDLTKEHAAWDTFIWFASLIMLGTFLNRLGFISWLSSSVGGSLSGFSKGTTFAVLLGIYFYSHYLFASTTAHASAMLAAFLAISLKIGINPMFAALSLSFCGSLCGSLTHFSTGQAPLFFGSGHISVKDWWIVGLFSSFVNLIIWLGVGSIWWKVIGIM